MERAPLSLRGARRSLPFLLLGYSIVHFVLSSGLMDPIKNIGGDFNAGFPNFWAWTINPKMIEENGLVQRWMGPKEIFLSPHSCEEGGWVRPPPVCDDFDAAGYMDVGARYHTYKNQTWLYGPVMHFLTFPLLYMPNFFSALRVWHTLLCLLFLLAGVIWYRMLFDGQGGLWSFVLFAALWLNFMPLYQALHGAEIEVLKFFLMTLVIHFALRRQDALSGLALGLSIMTKFLPGIFLPYFILKKRYRIVGVSLLTIFIVGVMAEIFLGWRWNYTFRIVRDGGIGPTWLHSHSLSTWVHRWFTHVDFFRDSIISINSPVPTHPVLAGAIALVLRYSLVFLYGTFFWIGRAREVRLSEIGILALLMIVLPPWDHIHYHIFFLIGYAV